MTFLDAVHPVGADDLPRIVDVWEASVRAEHAVVSEAYIEFFKPIVRDELVRLVELSAVRGRDGAIVGFVGVADERIEALFVHPAWRRMGVGRRLVDHAVMARGATSIDLDEQNVGALAFFLRLGFAVVGRTDIAGVGKAFPRVQLQYQAAASC
jgi:putative acetyltransferase